jgi:hypothetical protein
MKNQIKQPSLFFFQVKLIIQLLIVFIFDVLLTVYFIINLYYIFCLELLSYLIITIIIK